MERIRDFAYIVPASQYPAITGKRIPKGNFVNLILGSKTTQEDVAAAPSGSDSR
jgi:hypothetical protein